MKSSTTMSQWRASSSYEPHRSELNTPTVRNPASRAEAGAYQLSSNSHVSAGSVPSRPHMCSNVEGLKAFLESADMVKFAGVQATPEMADDATDSARVYLKGDSANTVDQRTEV